jgi:hypothetical protein
MTYPPPMAAPVSISTPAAKGSKKGIIAALSLVVLVGGALAIVMLGRGGGKTADRGAVAANDKPANVGAAPVEPAKPADPATAGKPPEPVAVKPADVAKPTDEKPKDVKQPVAAKPEDDKPADDGSEPTSVKEDLDAAKAALDAKNYKQVIFLANRALKNKRAPRAFVLLTQAYCGLGDLGNANATLHSVRRADRGRVIRQCKSLGLDIGD